jgi:hypothetical protein
MHNNNNYDNNNDDDNNNGNDNNNNNNTASWFVFFVKYYSVDHSNKHDMGGCMVFTGEKTNTYSSFIRKTEKGRLLE